MTKPTKYNATYQREISVSLEEARKLKSGEVRLLRFPMAPQPVFSQQGGRWSWLCDTFNQWDCTWRDGDDAKSTTVNGPFICPWAVGDVAGLAPTFLLVSSSSRGLDDFRLLVRRVRPSNVSGYWMWALEVEPEAS